MSEADFRLRSELGAEPPSSLAELTDEDRAALADLLAAARAQQTQSLSTAFDATLRHVPFPLRKVVKKVLLG